MFIDSLIASRSKDVVWMENETAYLPLPPGTAIALSPTHDGRMKWTRLQAVTRHLPINKDKSATLLRITTQSGREVTVTKGKSLLVFDGTQLNQTDGDKLQIGDRLPVVKTFACPKNTGFLDLRSIFDEGEKDVLFTMHLPPSTRELRAFERDDVLSCGGAERLPRKIALDFEFGALVGSYLLNGRLMHGRVEIDITDIEILGMIQRWASTIGVRTEIVCKNSIVLQSLLLEKVIRKSCGAEARERRMPSFALVAGDSFVTGFVKASADVLDSYTFHSKLLRDGFCLLLSRMEVGTALTSSSPTKHHIVVDDAKTASYLNDASLECVTHIEEVESFHRYVYDLTVEETTNMTTTGGIGCADTFHVRVM